MSKSFLPEMREGNGGYDRKVQRLILELTKSIKQTNAQHDMSYVNRER